MQIKNNFVISKYNPQSLDKNGAYLDQEEWTDCSDINKSVTLEDYLEVEEKYVNAALLFFENSKLPYLRVTFLNPNYKEYISDLKKNQPYLYDPEFEKLDFFEDQKVEKDIIKQIIRLNLRCVETSFLSINENFFIGFSHDFQMHIKTNFPSDKAIEHIQHNGLFVDPIDTPYFLNRRDFTTEPATLRVYSNKDNLEISSAATDLVGIGLSDLQDFFDYSEEHPMCGDFAVNCYIAKKIQKKLDYNFDFKKYSYSIDTVE